jgi:glycine oxidase
VGHNAIVRWNVRLWPEMLEDHERAVLGRRDDLSASDLRPDILVVGGGIMGVAVARACEQARLGRVLLVESSDLGSGATGGALGLCTPEPHHGVDPEPLAVLGRSSLELWRALEDEVPGGVGLVDIEWIGLLDDERDVVGRSPAAELLGADDVARLVPGLARAQPGMRIPGQARVNPLAAAARIAAALRSVATSTPAASVHVEGGRIRSVVTSAGTVSPGTVVFTTGGPPALEGVESRSAADFVRGHLVVTEPAPVRLPGTVDPIATQLPDGRLVVGGTLDDGEDPAVEPSIVEALLGELHRRLPATQDVRAERAWCCFRPHHPHGLPVIDRLAGLDNAWFTSGHFRTGILMAPATAAALAEWISTGASVAAAPFAAP